VSGLSNDLDWCHRDDSFRKEDTSTKFSFTFVFRFSLIQRSRMIRQGNRCPRKDTRRYRDYYVSPDLNYFVTGHYVVILQLSYSSKGAHVQIRFVISISIAPWTTLHSQPIV